MKLLLFSDLHRDLEQAARLVERSHDADIVVAAGDICSMHSGLEATIAILRRIERPTVLVPGNAETVDELVAACEAWPSSTVLHGTGDNIDGVDFFGLGGGVPVTPFGSWSYDFTEQQATELLGDCPENAILVTHSPPKGILDSDSTGRSLGSTAVAELIESKHPRLVVCGHIHACGGRTERTGATTVVNAGPRGVVWDLS